MATWTLTGPGGATAELTPSARITSNNLLAIRQALRADAGISFMPEFVLHDPCGDVDLVPVLPGWMSIGADLFAVYPSVRNLSPKVRVFLDYLSRQPEARAQADRDLVPMNEPGRPAGPRQWPRAPERHC